MKHRSDASTGPSDRLELNVHVHAWLITRTLLLALGVALLCHLIGVYEHFGPHRRSEAWVVLFDMDLEANLPTFFNAFLFFLCAGLAVLKAAGREGRLRRGWFIVAGVLAFLGVDEGTQIHEKFMLVTLRLMNHGSVSGRDFGWLYYAWVIPYVLAFSALGILLLRWFLALSAQLRRGLLLCGLLYVFGAVFLEMYSGKVAEKLSAATADPDLMACIPCETYGASVCHIYADLTYVVVYTLEEVCEMLALILCADLILRSLEKRHTSILLRFTPRTAQPS